MSYEEIFILGWKLNAFMLVLNLFIVLKALKTKDSMDLHKENESLEELKNEFTFYYPYRKYATLLSYLTPFMGFFKILFNMVEMFMFFQKNEGTSLFEFMLYRYQRDINRAKNNH